MSLSIIEKVLSDYIISDKSQVLVVKGAWGSGKTHFFQEFIQANKDKNNLGFSKYSYVSLFGIKDINEVRFLIYQNSISVNEIGDGEKKMSKKKFFGKIKNLKTLKYNGVSIFDGLHSLIQITGLIHPKEYLICFDDFERLSEKITIEEILGLISELKEQRKCKIVLIMNEEEIKNKNYKQIKEKIVDVELDFNPSPNECASVVFQSEDEGGFREICTRIGIQNIRVLSKIKHFYSLILPHLNNYCEGLVYQAKFSISFLTYIYYTNSSNNTDSEIPGIYFVKTEDNIGPINLDTSNVEEEYKTKWRSFFRKINWSHSDDFDLELLNIIQRGYVIDEDFHRSATKINLTLLNSNIQKEYRNIWDEYYHIGFKDNEEELVEKFLNFYESKSSHLDISELNTVVHIFKNLGRNEEATKLIKYFISCNEEDIEKLNLDNFRNFSSRPLDDEVKTMILSAYTSLNTDYKCPIKVLEAIIEKSGSLGKKDEEVLFGLSENDIYDILVNTEGNKLHNYIEILLKYKKVLNATDDWSKLTEKTIGALKRLENCKINKVRLEGYSYLK